MTDKELIDLINSNKEKGFKYLFDAYSHLIFSTVIKLIQNQEEAEELVQDTFVTAYQKIDSFNFKSKLSTWLYRIAVNKSLDTIKSNKRKFRIKQVQSLFNGKSLEAPDFLHPGILSEQNELQEILLKAVSGLPAKQQAAYALSKFEGKSNKEVSQILNSSVSSVESLLIRAKSNLKKRLSLYYESNFK